MGRPQSTTRTRRLLFALVPLIALFGGLEVALRGLDLPPGEVPLAHDGFYVWYRAQALGDWYLREWDEQGRPFARANPALLPRGIQPVEVPLEAGAGHSLWAIGGSTTYGIPYEHEGGFPKALQDRLGPSWRVNNAGVAGMDSEEFPGLVRELVELGGDGLIIYAGNNELQGASSEACIVGWRLASQRSIDRVRLLRALRWALRGGRAEALDLAAIQAQHAHCEEQVLRDQWAMAEGHDDPSVPGWPMRVDPWYQGLLQRFEDNLRRTIAMAQAADMQVWLVIPPINLRVAPAYMGDPPGLGVEALRDYQRALAAGAWEEAVAIAPTDARARHALGLALEARGELEGAREQLRIAADRDWRSLRITPGLQDRVRALCAAEPTVHCVDVDTAFIEAAGGGIPGVELFVDHCHPTRERGVGVVADALADAVKASW